MKANTAYTSSSYIRAIRSGCISILLFIFFASAAFADPNRVAEQFLVEHMPVELKSSLAPVLP